MSTHTSPKHVLVSHPDAALRRLMLEALGRESYATSETADAGATLQAVQRRRVDAVVLAADVRSAGALERCTEIRAASGAPLLVVSASGAEDDMVAALMHGADDCIAEPFSSVELVARVGALLRRAAMQPRSAAPPRRRAEVEVVGDFRLDRTARTVHAGRSEIALGRREFDLLSHLLAHSGRACSREDLIAAVWGRKWDGDPKTVDVHVHHLRGKLAAVTGVPLRISTVTRVGYRLDRLDSPSPA